MAHEDHFVLSSARMFYGGDACEMHGFADGELDRVPARKASTIAARRIAQALHQQNPALSTAEYEARITLTRAEANPRYGAPECITARGNGFAITWVRR
jgi:hypothetical protein